MSKINNFFYIDKFLQYGLTFIGISLSIIFFMDSQKKREPVVYDSIPPIKIFDGSNSTKRIQVIYDDTHLINENIYLKTITVINEGKLPINNNDVRAPLTITVNDKNKVLSYKISNQIEDGISNFRAYNKLTDTYNNITIEWDYFDPKNEFTLNIIYTGKKEIDLEYSGKFLDVEKIYINQENSLIKKLIRILALISPFLISISSTFAIYSSTVVHKSKPMLTVTIIVTGVLYLLSYYWTFLIK